MKGTLTGQCWTPVNIVVAAKLGGAPAVLPEERASEPRGGFSPPWGERGSRADEEMLSLCRLGLHPEGLGIASVPWLQGCDLQRRISRLLLSLNVTARADRDHDGQLVL